MIKIVTILLLLVPTASLAGQATGSFGVGIRITGLASPNTSTATPAAQSGLVSEQEWLAYCAARYRSFDPASGTYLGFDGNRHPCQ